MPLYAAQAKFLDSKVPFRAFCGGRGAGKSWVAAYDLLKRAKPGRTYMLVSPSYKILIRSDLRTFLALARQLGLLLGFRKGDMTASLVNGAEVICASADDPESLRGPNLSGVAMSEASLMVAEAYFVCIASLREAGEFGWLTACFTPKGKSHWTYQVFGTGRPDTELIVAATWENPFLDQAVHEKLKLQYGEGLRARQELAGEFVQLEGAEWPGEYFQPSIWFDDWPTDLHLKVLTLDPSKGREAKNGDYAAFVFLGRSAGDRRLYVDAWLRKDLTVADLCREGLRLYREKKPDGFGVEVNQFQHLVKQEIERLAAEASLPGIRTYGIHNRENKELRIRRLTAPLSRGEFRFKANSPGAALLVQQLQEFPVGEHDDGPDALEMALRLAVELHSGRQEEDRPILVIAD